MIHTPGQKVTLIDSSIAGVSGDMLLGALVDAGANKAKIKRLTEIIPEFLSDCGEIDVVFEKVKRSGIQATRLGLNIHEHVHHREGETLMIALNRILPECDISKEASNFAVNALKTLIQTEAAVHNESFDHVHLHEAGSADTIFDIAGIAIALDSLDVFNSKVYGTHPSIGGGIIEIDHGKYPVPPPATTRILKDYNIPFKGGPVEKELVTPTGISILANLVTSFATVYPTMTITAEGYGAGKYEFHGIPNVTRVIIGDAVTRKFYEDEIITLETNVDDVTGEVLGYTMNKLLHHGALDVSYLNTVTKKNRPGYLIKVITKPEDSLKLASILFEETGTLGIRTVPGIKRLILSRSVERIPIEIGGKGFYVRIKIGKDSEDNILTVKPEFEDLKDIADETGEPIKSISEIALKAGRKKFLGEE
ncbi:MAG: nickel pincer cofactor biosynthesis protein LarC [Promethearchaeota archaeon]